MPADHRSILDEPNDERIAIGWRRPDVPALPTAAAGLSVTAGLITAWGVVGQRVGLGLALTWLGIVVAVALVRWRPAGALQRSIIVISAALAAVPVLRDAGWVVVTALAAAAVGLGFVCAGGGRWPALIRGTVIPGRVTAGLSSLTRTVFAERSLTVSRRRVGVLGRGIWLGAVGVIVFGGLFAAADRAFAELLGSFELPDPGADDVRRLLVGLLVAGIAAAFVRVSLTSDDSPADRADDDRWVPGIGETRIAIGAVVCVFTAFIAVQIRVIVGGARYVERTVGLGYGEYAREGFIHLLIVAGITLGVIAVAGRTRDRVVRAMLGALCLLCILMLVSAANRLRLVEDAYGLTRVRVAGAVLLVWLVVLLGGVIAAGLSAAVRRRLPVLSVLATLIAAAGLALANPDARIAKSAVDRFERSGASDAGYVAGLSADALSQLRPGRVPAVFDDARGMIESRLARPDGVWGANRARAVGRRHP